MPWVSPIQGRGGEGIEACSLGTLRKNEVAKCIPSIRARNSTAEKCQRHEHKKQGVNYIKKDNQST